MHDITRELVSRVYLAVAIVSAALVPVVVVSAAHLTDDGGIARALVAWLIAMLSGLAVYTAAAATHAQEGFRARSTYRR